MNKKEKLEYKYTNRQDIERRKNQMPSYPNIHDEIYTFRDEYYDDLMKEIVQDYLEDENLD